ncbi:leucine-rich repeat-containing protein 27 isoform X1 [Phyllostomus discolor]|uniref:Leucine-rich repeat-containing protein 27 isoform X1 n=1 Tax=Phyllostomus discolor TaxID=89673 RepID=A0A6J2LMC7_9CHIR|nr:leucine-rich repeat-containing protein 27 isoform X1 [Phyllostomus discolor]
MEGTGAGAAAAPDSSAASESSAAPAGSPPASPSTDSPGKVPGILFSSLPVLDLSQNGLQHLGDVLKIPTLKQLHLQRNALRAIPPDFFQLLPSLTWLDLRHNRIEALPPGVGSHRCLKTLLLERNPIKTLPVELGNVRTLRALNLRCCPVEFPPQLVVQKGPAAILSFLRACATEPAPRATLPPEKTAPSQSQSQPPHPRWDSPKEHPPNIETTDSQEPEETWLPEAPELSEPRRCTRSGEDWPTEEELRRFWKLRQEIVEKEQAEVLENQLLAVELPPNLRAMLRGGREEARPSPRQALRRTAPSFRGALPSLASAYLAASWAGQLEERRASALRELQEKQALMEQRRRDQRVLQQWREQAQVLRRKEELGRLRPPRRTLVASEGPFATDLPDKARALAHPPGQRVHGKERPLRGGDTLRAGHQGALEDRLRRHLWQVRERRPVFGGTVPLGAIRKAAEDPEIARKLQDEAVKQNPGPP